MNLDLIKHAKNYIEKMAKGINPLNDEKIPEQELLNNINISRCLFFVSDCLDFLLKQERRKIQKERPFSITTEKLKQYEFSEYPISLSDIAKRLNIYKEENTKNLNVNKVQEWLVSLDILKEEIQNGKRTKKPTDTGSEIGITREKRTNFDGINYTINLYNKNAQTFIIDNFENLLEFLNK